MEINQKKYRFGDMQAIFATIDGTTQFLLLPEGCGNINEEKLAGVSPFGVVISREPMIHVALAGDRHHREFMAGNTLRNSETAYKFRLCNQTLESLDGCEKLVSRFENGEGLVVDHVIEYRAGTNALVLHLEMENFGDEITVEAFPSFNLSGISPFRRYHDPSKLILHKMLSNWSGEGKLYSVSTDKLAFEPSWSGLGTRLEKWSQTGTMPARGQFPFVALEDTESGTVWAVAAEAPASWVIETAFRNGNLCIGGGRGDFLSAHWRKTLKTGERLVSDRAYVTAVAGTLDSACARLVKSYDNTENLKLSERDLPVMYNEYCYSWCKPREEELLRILPVAKQLGCAYFVVDDGWFIKDYGKGAFELGDWEIDPAAFPDGLKNFCDKVRAEGMVPGVWFEFEAVTEGSKLYRERPDLLLTYQGKIISHEGHAFLDFRKEETKEYLWEKVIKTLAENRIGYMKVDYNENIGLGVDGAESYGEGLRRHIESVLSFFEEIKRTLPDLVLEICSSGGMRHEPRFLKLADMVSFSDAHENASGVNVACNLHRYIPPRKMQIWATIRSEHTLEEVRFTMAKAMLGRCCFSGDLSGLSQKVIEELEHAVSFYRSAVPVIREGETVLIDDQEIDTYFKPKGRTALVRESLDKKRKLLYAFSIDAPLRDFEIEVGGYRVAEGYNLPSDFEIRNGIAKFSAKDCPLWGSVILLEQVTE